MIGFAPGEQIVLERPNYKITDKEGKRSWEGTLTNKGLTERVFTPEKTELVVWLGDGEWKIIGEYEHGPYEDDAQNIEDFETATIEMVFFNFAWAHLTDLDYKLVAGEQTVTGKTDSVGSAQTLKGIKSGTSIEVWVMQEQKKEFKKIGSINAFAGETNYWVISPKIKAEGTTEIHLESTAPEKVETTKTETKPASVKMKAPPQKTETELTSNKDKNPQASLVQKNILPLIALGPIGAMGALFLSSWVKKQVGGNTSLTATTMPSKEKAGSPVSDENILKLKKLIDFAERQVKFDYKKFSKQQGVTQTLDVLSAYEDKYANNKNAFPDFDGADEKGCFKFNGYCLAYVKYALKHTGMINGYPFKTEHAKNSGKEWTDDFQYTDVSSILPEVEVEYVNVYSDKGESKIQGKLNNESKIAKLKQQLKSKKVELATAQKSPNLKISKTVDAAKVKKAEDKIENKKIEISETEDQIKSLEKENGNFEQPDTETIIHPQPDLMYTLPGDLIVYNKIWKKETDKNKVEPVTSGHIDIRTYHGFVSDAAWPRAIPALGQGKSLYRVIGVYRKISDTKAMARVQAFLRILREQVAGETSLAEKDRSYHLLTYDKDSKDPFAEGNMNGDLSKGHPSESSNKNIRAGAYQIGLTSWRDSYNATGWPRTFTPDMQDRIAMYLLQAYPSNFTTGPFPRRGALGYIMEGYVEKAVSIIKQERNLSNWHDITNAKFDMNKLNSAFEKYSKDDSK